MSDPLMTLCVEFDDGTSRTLAVAPREMIALERQFDIAVVKLSDEMRFEWLAFLAYACDTKRAVTPPTFDDWLLPVAAIKPVDDDPKDLKASEGSTT